MKKELIISKIFKEEAKNNSIRACSIIKSDKDDYKLWFEVEKEYEKYILTERSDAFLIAVLPYAIKKELDIVVEGKISSRLHYQLTTYLVPMLCKTFNKKTIEIHSELDNNLYNIEKAVGTGMSGGIDSFYTVKKHINLEEREFNITHLTFFNVGASGNYGGEESRNIYKSRMNFPRKFAEENNFKFVSVDSNLSEFLMMHHLYTHTFRSLSCALLLQKLFSKYYYSSTGFEFNETKLDEEAAYADILILQNLSTEDIMFYSTGMETNRIGKMEEVAKYKPSYDILSVCIFENHNCGICNKCRRTLLELYTIDKLELYKNVFNLDYFYKHKTEYLIWLLKMKRRKSDLLCIYLYNEYKKRKGNIPIFVNILSLIPDKTDIKLFAYKLFSKEKIRKKFGKINDGWKD